MIRYAAHARARLRDRGTTEAWGEETLAAPETVQQDPVDPGLTRSYRVIAAAGDRALRVVHRRDGADTLVITALLDRDATP